jgi:hypothetical protein
MFKELVKLADFLDEKGLSREAGIVDSFIVRSQISEQTWVDDDTKPGGLNQTPPANSYRTSNKIQLADGIQLDLITHPLGQKLWKFVQNIFLLSDDSTDQGALNVKDLEDIIQTTFKYDDELNIYKGLDDNPEPITPTQLQKIVNDIVVLFSRQYKTSGIIDPHSIRDLTFNLIQYYNDVYLEEYLKFPVQNFEAGGEIQGHVPQELNALKREKLWEKEDERLNADSAWLENIDPDSEQERSKVREELKKETPKEWHSILFDK